MNSLREQQLIEGLKGYFYAVQKSEQIYKKLSKWERKTFKMDDQEIGKAAKFIASKVEAWVVTKECENKKPSLDEVKKKIAEELGHFSK